MAHILNYYLCFLTLSGEESYVKKLFNNCHQAFAQVQIGIRA